jgi:hypothetical protein
MMVGERPLRLRSVRHLRRVGTRRCAVPNCRRRDVVPHHPTHVQPKARGLKCGDQFAVPLCGMHHDARSPVGVHHTGDEAGWWRRIGVDPLVIARDLWSESVQVLGFESHPTSRARSRRRGKSASHFPKGTPMATRTGKSQQVTMRIDLDLLEAAAIQASRENRLRSAVLAEWMRNGMRSVSSPGKSVMQSGPGDRPSGGAPGKLVASLLPVTGSQFPARPLGLRKVPTEEKTDGRAKAANV